MFSTYINFLHRYRWPLAIFFVLLFVASLFEAKKLKLRSDFKELLPEQAQSVRDMNKIIARVGGEGALNIDVESEDPEASIRFADDIVKKLKEYPPEYINRIEYNASDSKKFFEDNKYLYMDLEDVEEIYNRLDRRIQREKLEKSGLMISFETADEKEAQFSTKDIEDKYKSKTSRYEHFRKGYFFNEEQNLLVIIVRPPGSATGVGFSKLLVEKVRQTIQELDPSKYHPSMKVGLSGKFRRVLFEYQTLIEDITSTAVLCVALVSLAVFIYYRRWRMVFLMGWTVFNGVVWTFALTAFAIGYLTSQTAFLGSILVGNGINYSLILMARYLEERKSGESCLQSLQTSIPATFAGTLASSLTTSVAFGVLIISQIKGFSHFGFIGGVGMFVCWVATYTVLPVFLSISEQLWPIVKTSFSKKEGFSLMAPLSRAITQWAKPISLTALGLTILSLVAAIYFIPHSLEYDFSKLKVKDKSKLAREEADLANRVAKIFSMTTSPAVVITDRADQAPLVRKEIERRNQLDPELSRVVHSVRSLDSYVPENQPEKLGVLRKMRSLLETSALNFLSPEQKAEVEKFKSQFNERPVALQDLPKSILENFREKNGDLGKLVYVYSSDKVPLSDGKNLLRFSEIIRTITLPNGDIITASGESVIFADLLQAIIHDGPTTTLFAFLAVCLVVVVIFRERRAILFIIGTLVIGIIWMGGTLALFKIKINFFNFIAIPTTFGIGVDYGVNIYQRYKLEGPGSLGKVLRTTGGAVLLCSITTIIGYFTLIIAKNQALVSFGWIGILGELTCLVAALFFVPAFVTYLETRKSLNDCDNSSFKLVKTN